MTVIVDRGTGFLAEFAEMIQKDLSLPEIHKQTQLLRAYIKLLET